MSFPHAKVAVIIARAINGDIKMIKLGCAFFKEKRRRREREERRARVPKERRDAL